MYFWKITKHLLWSVTMFILLLAALKAYQTWQFIDKALVTKAVVVNRASQQQTRYTPVYQFKTRHATVIRFTDTNTFLNPVVSTAQPVEVIYNPVIPVEAYRHSVLSIWFQPVATALLGFLLISLLISINYFVTRRKRNLRKLLRQGNHIFTKFSAVEANLSAQKNGKHAYQIISHWTDPKTNKRHEFKSENIWFNPLDYILDQTITVMIDNKNKNKYYMDTTFLPDTD